MDSGSITSRGLLLLDRYYSQENLMPTKAFHLLEVGLMVQSEALKEAAPQLAPLFHYLVNTGRALSRTDHNVVEIFREIRNQHPDLLPAWTQALMEFKPRVDYIDKTKVLASLASHLISNYQTFSENDLLILRSFLRLKAKKAGLQDLNRRLKKDADFARLAAPLDWAVLKNPDFLAVASRCNSREDILTYDRMLTDYNQMLAQEADLQKRSQLVEKLINILEAGPGGKGKLTALAGQLEDPALPLSRELKDRAFNLMIEYLRFEAQQHPNPKLIEKLDQDAEFLKLLPSLVKLILDKPPLVKIAHLFRSRSEIETYQRLVTNPLETLKAEADLNKRRELVEKIISLVETGVLERDILIQLLKGNGSVLSRELNHRIAKLFLDGREINRLDFLLEKGETREALPGKIEGLGREMAELAHKALGLTRGVASHSKKPTLTIYILTTAHGFNGERILDGFYHKADVRRKMIERIGAADAKYAKKIERLASQSGAERTEEEMRIIHQAFYEYVEHLQKKEGYDRLSAIMKIGSLWVERGYLPYFTYPLEIKIPSGSAPSPEVTQQLKGLAEKAQKNGWDIMFIDHSTVRSIDVPHPNDPKDFEKGRAIARGMEIMWQALSAKQIHKVWLYKENNWALPDILGMDAVNVLGLNLYAGRVYDMHVWGRKEEWVKIDDHGKTVLGVAVEKDGAKATTTLVFPVLNGDGYYKMATVASLFWRAFRVELAKLEGWPPTAPSFRYSNLLFVCNANHHRSTTFEILTKELLRYQMGPDAEKLAISSAGIEAESYLRDHPDKGDMSGRAKQMLRDHGISVDTLPKTQLTAEQIAVSDLILVMTERERKALLDKFPQARSKVRVVKEFLDFPPEEQDLPTPRNFDAADFEVFFNLAQKITERITS